MTAATPQPEPDENLTQMHLTLPDTTPQPPPVSDLECIRCKDDSSPHGVAWAGSGFTAPAGDVTAGQAPADWWVCTGVLPPGGNGQKIIGPFATQELALNVRTYVEKAEKRSDLWVDDEPQAAIAAQDARPAPELAAAMAELADALEAEGREEIAIARKRQGTRHEVGMQRGRVFELCVDRIRRVAGLPS